MSTLLHASLDQRDKVSQQKWSAIAEVYDFASEARVDSAHDASDDIINVGVVAGRGTVPVLLDGLFIVDAVDEFKWRHIRSASRTIDSEEAQTGAVEAVQVVEGVRQQFAV